MLLLDLFELIAGSLTFIITGNTLIVSFVVMMSTILKVLYKLLTSTGDPNEFCTSALIIFSCLLTIITNNAKFFQIKAMLVTLLSGIFIIINRLVFNTSSLDYLIKSIPIPQEAKSNIDLEVGIILLFITAISFIFFIRQQSNNWFIFKSYTVPIIFTTYITLKVFQLASELFSNTDGNKY